MLAVPVSLGVRGRRTSSRPKFHQNVRVVVRTSAFAPSPLRPRAGLRTSATRPRFRRRRPHLDPRPRPPGVGDPEQRAAVLGDLDVCRIDAAEHGAHGPVGITCTTRPPRRSPTTLVRWVPTIQPPDDAPMMRASVPGSSMRRSPSTNTPASMWGTAMSAPRASHCGWRSLWGGRLRRDGERGPYASARRVRRRPHGGSPGAWCGPSTETSRDGPWLRGRRTNLVRDAVRPPLSLRP